MNNDFDDNIPDENCCCVCKAWVVEKKGEICFLCWLYYGLVPLMVILLCAVFLAWIFGIIK